MMDSSIIPPKSYSQTSIFVTGKINVRHFLNRPHICTHLPSNGIPRKRTSFVLKSGKQDGSGVLRLRENILKAIM